MNVERERDRIAEHLAALPAEAWDRPVPPPPPAAYEEEPRRLRVRPLVAVAAAAALLGLGVATGLLVAGGEPGRGVSAGQAVALEALGSAPKQAAGQARLSRDRATVRVSGLRPSRAGQFYELWLIGEGGRLVSLGSFRALAAGTAALTVPVPVDPGRFRTVDVSVERADGDPGHSGVSVLRGRS